MAETTTILSLDAGEVAATTVALQGLGKVLDDISQGVKEAFTVRGYRDYLQTVSRFGKSLTNELLVLQMAFGRLKVAIAKAFAPVLEVVVPYINQAIFAIIRFANTVRQFLSGLFAGVRGNDALAQSAENAADAENTLAKAASSAGKAAKRSLMGLDQLERLNAPTGGGGSGGYSFGAYQDTVSPEVQAVVDQILALLAPLMAIDLLPLKTALQGLWESVSAVVNTIGSGLQWLWYEVLTPFLAYLAESFAPAMVDTFAAGLDMVRAALEPLILGIQSLGQNLQPVTSFIAETVVLALQAWQGAFSDLVRVFQEKAPRMLEMFQNIGTAFTGVWTTVKPVLVQLREYCGKVFDLVRAGAASTVGGLIDALATLTGYVAGVFTTDWEVAWDGVESVLKGMVNGIVGLLNAMISRLVSALNSVIRAANSLSFTVPSWVPNLGGKTFGFNMHTVSAPQVPYLARGAVLPANKPFLAMVGDQRHGTNVEAPLSTIQEAVALVMEDQTAALLAGFEASTKVQREILEAVLGIHIGDEVISNAVNRYNRKLSVMRGGAL